MSNQGDPPNDDAINLDLSLATLHPHEEDPVDEQGLFQFFQPVSDPSPPPQMMSPPILQAYNMMPPVAEYTNPPALPSGVVSVAAPSPHLPAGQLSQPPPQATDARPVTAARGRPRRNTARAAGKTVGVKEIVPLYKWATTRPAVIHTAKYLYSKNIKMISGEVYCGACKRTDTLEYNLEEKFKELSTYIQDNKEVLRQRAPTIWRTPEIPACGICESGMKPVLKENKEEINWLFLLLGKMLGCCTLEQLRYFCDKTNQHRTGAKDRVLYITYLGLCKQLDPDGPFNL